MKKYLGSWNASEILWLISFSSLSIYMYYQFNDTPINLLISIAGLFCVLLVAKGSIWTYFFGMITTSLYAYTAYKVQLYGESMLNAFYFFPIQFIGLYAWLKNRGTHSDHSKIEVKSLTLKGWAYVGITVVIVSVLYGFFLHEIGSKQAHLDGFAVVLSIVAQVLMVRRYVEQWILWIIVNMITIALWYRNFIVDGGHITILIMWCAYLYNSIYGYIIWRKANNKKDNLL